MNVIKIYQENLLNFLFDMMRGTYVCSGETHIVKKIQTKVAEMASFPERIKNLPNISNTI